MIFSLVLLGCITVFSLCLSLGLSVQNNQLKKRIDFHDSLILELGARSKQTQEVLQRFIN